MSDRHAAYGKTILIMRIVPPAARLPRYEVEENKAGDASSVPPTALEMHVVRLTNCIERTRFPLLDPTGAGPVVIWNDSRGLALHTISSQGYRSLSESLLCITIAE